MKAMKACFCDFIVDVCFDVDFTFIFSTSEIADKTTLVYWIVEKGFYIHQCQDGQIDIGTAL